MTTTVMTPLSTDAARLRTATAFVRDQDTAALLPLLLPGIDALELRALADRCRFSHAGLLVFPPSLEALRAELSDCGLDPDVPTSPSVVVRDRLAARHRRDASELDVHIMHPHVCGPDGSKRTVEVFVLAVEPGSGLAEIAEYERGAQHEAHLALEMEEPDPLVLRGTLAILVRHGARPDGGGYNPHQDGTVFYFTTPATSKAGYRRLEIYAHGDHRDVLTAHLDAAQARQPAETLLRLMSGAWTTQALAAFAQLRLPEAMSPDAGTRAEDLARATDTHPESLTRLLRYLAMLDVVSYHRDGDHEDFRLTAIGVLLRADTPNSMRPLALMYGGPFYESFGALGHTVRTGRVGFDHVFGRNHFDHFAGVPELAELFDQSMAASSRMFEPLTTHPVITAAAAKTATATSATAQATTATSATATVVDIAGGNGALLGRLMAAHPGLRGALLERPDTIEAARRTLADVADRCTYLAGDFADVPSGGDVYILSRVLHDWDDERCVEILRHCARAMPEDADLLIVERLLPADGSPSLATSWDLHMMCNVGGRERHTAHYARLLAAAGLTLVDCSTLPLEAAVLHARRT